MNLEKRFIFAGCVDSDLIVLDLHKQLKINMT